MARGTARLRVEVVYALPDRQVLLALEVKDGTTVQDVIMQSGITRSFPDLDAVNSPVGIFGKRVTRQTLVKDGDRIEIYRPLIADPKSMRRARARGKR